MTIGFTPEELRQLAISDRAQGGGGNKPGRPGRPKSIGMGRLTDDEVMAMHKAGANREAIAEAAHCHPNTVTRWRSEHGMSRGYNRKGDA